MDEQISLIGFQTKEEQTYHLIQEHILSVIEANFLCGEDLSLTECKGYWSITYASALIARIHFGKTVSYFSVDVSASKDLLDASGITYDIKSSDKSFARILIREPEDILPCLDVIAAVTQCVLDTIPKAFDCCSHFEACSDAKRCIQPNDELRLGCGYRKILASGRIFCGKNRNID